MTHLIWVQLENGFYAVAITALKLVLGACTTDSSSHRPHYLTSVLEFPKCSQDTRHKDKHLGRIDHWSMLYKSWNTWNIKLGLVFRRVCSTIWKHLKYLNYPTWLSTLGRSNFKAKRWSSEWVSLTRTEIKNCNFMFLQFPFNQMIQIFIVLQTYSMFFRRKLIIFYSGATGRYISTLCIN